MKKAVDRFGPLKAALGAISNQEVRLRLPAQNPSLTNASAGNRRHQKQSRRPPRPYSRTGGTFRNASKQCHRTEAPGRIDTVRRHSLIRLGTELLLAHSTASKDNFNLCLRSQSYRNLVAMFRMVKIFPDSSKIYGRPSLITRFVHVTGTLLSADEGDRRCNKW